MMKAVVWCFLVGLASASLQMDQECVAFVDEHVYQATPASPSLDSRSLPLADKYSALLDTTCGSALKGVPVLPSSDAADFMKAYVSYNGTNSEADVIKKANALLSRKDVMAFFALPDSLDEGGQDGSGPLRRSCGGNASWIS